MNSRNVAIVVFTDGKDLVVQERGNHSKMGKNMDFGAEELKKVKVTNLQSRENCWRN